MRADATVCGAVCRAERSRRLRGVHYVAEPCSAPRSGSNARSGLQVSYRKAVLAAQTLAYSMVWRDLETSRRPSLEEIRDAGEAAMQSVLSDRQRARLQTPDPRR